MGGGTDRVLEDPLDSAAQERLATALEEARERGEALLAEAAGQLIARGLGLRVPRFSFLADAGETVDLETFAGDRLVVKAAAPDLAHKSDVGGVAVCPRDAGALKETLETMDRRVREHAVPTGFTVHEYVEHDRSAGGELLLGVRWSDDFGPVAVLGPGGLEAERLAAAEGLAPILLAAAAVPDGAPLLPQGHLLVDLLTEPWRGSPPRIPIGELEAVLLRLLAFAEHWMAPDREHRIADFEINPMVWAADGPWALDVLTRRASGAEAIAPPRPLSKLERLLQPASIAVAGVSRRRNVGRIIVENILRRGFDRERLWIVKPGADVLAGCRCVPDFASLPEPVDLAVLSVEAVSLPAMVEEIVAGSHAESLILIPGGVGEREGSQDHARRIESAIHQARDTPGGGPVVNGGNCLGVRSRPGNYDTLFIPEHKLLFDGGRPAPLAFLSQSGAFAIARASVLEHLDPRYLVTFGNQVDLTVADYLSYLEGDPEVRVFACYVEGFRPLDGRRFLEATRRITASGRAVLLYRAGRTEAGARAAASHTASVAGSYRVTRELARRAGALVADTLEDFEDLVRIFCGLDRHHPTGRHLGAVTNAGFESVAIGDNLGRLELAAFSSATLTTLEELLAQYRLDTIVAPRNPLDVTPILDDPGFAGAVRTVLNDGGVDLGLVGCVPLTGALQTLPAGEGHPENLVRDGAVARRLVDLYDTSTKPWIATVDSGSLYDPLARFLEAGGIPTFRSVDRALRALGRWVEFQLGLAAR